MGQERFFVTGALGCLGAWVVRNLIRDGASVTTYDLGSSRHRLALVMSDDEIAQVNFLSGDVTDTDAVAQAVTETGTTHIIHLAALQVPFCRANPVVGAQVNVVGTVNIFEAVRKAGLQHVVYASSVAVYGTRDDYSERLLPNDAPHNPQNLYGVYKQANEGTAAIYYQDHGISSTALRPYTIYGPGRDQGMTSTPTKAMLAAAAGQPYRITYGGYNAFQYVDDIARTFILIARAQQQGVNIYNPGGSVAHVEEIIAAIETVVPQAAGQITYEPAPLALPDGTDDSALRQALGDVPYTPLAEGVRQTIEHFQQALTADKVSLDQLSN